MPKREFKKDIGWQEIFDAYDLHNHNFVSDPFVITADEIKAATNNKEPRILCKFDTRNSRPKLFKELNLFLLPIMNGTYVLLQGEGYVDIPRVKKPPKFHESILDFELETAIVGDSEMQHVDFAYATSLIRSFMNDTSLVLTIRGRKFSPEFSFKVGDHTFNVSGVQTEVDAGYEGKDKVVLVEAKNSRSRNTIIRQIFYPLRQWSVYTDKPITTLFFEKQDEEYQICEFIFEDVTDYNSIKLVKSEKYIIQGGQ